MKPYAQHSLHMQSDLTLQCSQISEGRFLEASKRQILTSPSFSVIFCHLAILSVLENVISSNLILPEGESLVFNISY